MHVATVAQNGTLEIVAYVSEETRALLSVGMKVTVEDTYPATVTSIAPALDPMTKQIEVRVILSGKNSLVNGQSVRINILSDAPVEEPVGPLIPLTAVKLPSSRLSSRSLTSLVAHQVEIGDVHGDRIEIITPLPGDLEIVVDARSLSEGQRVATELSQ
jgi:multidrug efflux pump subunit AcrA (membrane-fusion protein)